MIKKLLLISLLLSAMQWARAQSPVANFSANVTSGCLPLSVLFTDQSTGSPKFWNWDFGNGQYSNLQNPATTYSIPGVYTVTLVVRNADGTNGITKTNYIVVSQSPQANFSANYTIGCAPSTIQFTDLTIPNAGTLVKWDWDFGDGGVSSAQNPSHQYTATGFYTVTLRVTSSTGCAAVASIGRYIRIVAGVIPDFDFSNPATCRSPFNVNFSNLTSGPGVLTYQWDFGNSTTSTQDNPAAVYATGGTYTVTLQATSEYGCSGTIQKPVNISGTNTTFTSPDTVCINSTVTFQNASSLTPKSSLWDFGNGLKSSKTNDTSTYNLAGNYAVKLINVYDNCKDSVTRPLVVMDKPAVNFTAPVTTACKGPLTVNFQDLSPDAATWLWDFGDGNTSSQQNPAHTYLSEAIYNVTLTITTHLGCSNTITKTGFVQLIKPTVAFTNAPNGDCIPFAFAPAATATAIDGVKDYFWEYGDAGFTATTNTPTGPVHSYAAAGAYTIKVTINTNGGCTVFSELVNGIRTGTPPVSNFSVTPTDACASSAINFTDLSTGTPAPGVDQWLWDFGDGTFSSDQNPVHNYTDSGYFSVTLSAYNNRCKTTSAAQIVHIKPPVAKFDFKVNCSNSSMVAFTNQSLVDPINYGPETYFWNFGDGATSPSPNPGNHTYATTGTYTAILTVSTATCSHTVSKDIQIVGETADFSISKTAACKNEILTLSAINSIPANVIRYEWSLDNGAFITAGRNIDTSFATAGGHRIDLVITAVNGCTSAKSIDPAVTITGPVANFLPVTKGGCRNKAISFTDLSTSTAGIKSWTFDFGDGTTKIFTAPPFFHNYADTGLFIVKLTVTDNINCPDTYTSADTIHITQPVPGFKANYVTICPKTDITFTDTSSGSGLHYVWDFGDGNTSTALSPVHQYAGSNGTYTVKLVITDTTGCMGSVTRTNYIAVKKPQPAFVAIDTSSICPPLETKFTFQGLDYQSFYWDFGDGTTSTLQNPKHFYNTYGSYEAKLYLVGYGGCLDSTSDTVNVYDPYASTNINYNAQPSCTPFFVDFTLTTPPSSSFIFYFGDGGADSSLSYALQHYYKDPGAYAPSVLLQDSLGCQVRVGGPTNISIIGAIPYFDADKKTFCDSGMVLFSDFTFPRTEPIISRTWDFGDGSTSSAVNPSHQYTQPGTYVVTQTVTSQNNCTNSVTDTIRIYGTPQPLIVSDTVICINNLLALQGSLVVPDTAITWKWNLGSNGQATSQNTSVKYSQAGNYTVSLEATNKLGCKGDTSKILLVPPTPVVTINGNTTIVVGTGMNIPVSYSPEVATYVWTPASGLSCTDCPVPFANPKFTTKYNVQVTDVYGCSATGEVTILVECNGKNYFVPNTFSPNGDGVNDVFMPRGSSISRVSRMQVFNRWGEIVYEKKDFMVNDASAGWNGTYKGKPANADVYIYVVEFVCENASIIPYRGNVTLIR